MPVMLYILLGPDDYTKKIYIRDLARNISADVAAFDVDDEVPDTTRLVEADLFSKPKVFVLFSLLFAEQRQKEDNEAIDKLVRSQNHIIVCVEFLDKRRKENKNLLARKDITVKEFNLPHGVELNKWTERRAGELGGEIAKAAVEELAVRLGRDQTYQTKEVYSLWQVESEIKKLIAFTAGRRIEAADVRAVVSENLEVNAFDIINAIGEGKKQRALDLMHKFLRAESAADEKAAVIQLNALLSDQMRSLAITQDFVRLKVSDTEIIKKTGWKSGRLYIMKKIAGRLSSLKILETLKKLEALDEALKTSQLPPGVLLDLIVSQIF